MVYSIYNSATTLVAGISARSRTPRGGARALSRILLVVISLMHRSVVMHTAYRSDDTDFGLLGVRARWVTIHTHEYCIRVRCQSAGLFHQIAAGHTLESEHTSTLCAWSTTLHAVRVSVDGRGIAASTSKSLVGYIATLHNDRNGLGWSETWILS